MLRTPSPPVTGSLGRETAGGGQNAQLARNVQPSLCQMGCQTGCRTGRQAGRWTGPDRQGSARMQREIAPRRRLILVVDDHDRLREMVSQILEDEGHEVVRARHGEAAMDVLAHRRPDLILLDLRMPVMDGGQFVRAYQRLPGPHAPIVTMTAGDDAAQTAAAIGAQSWLAKPFQVDDLLELVERLLLP